MGLFDKLTGSREPDDDVPAVPAAELRAALTSAGDGQWPGTVEEAEDGVLVARYRIEEPEWRTLLLRRQVSSTWTIRMRLVEEDHEVRSITEERELVEEQGVLHMSREAKAFRGQKIEVSKRWEGGGGDGIQETWSFSSQELLEPLREATVAHGWKWKGVAFGKL